MSLTCARGFLRFVITFSALLTNSVWAQAKSEPEPGSAKEKPIALRQRVDLLERQLLDLRRELREQEARPTPAPEPAPVSRAISERLLFSGEGAVGYYDSQAQGRFPNREFRIREARVFTEAKLAESAFLYSELNLAIPEDDQSGVKFGELYVDVEDLSRLWGGKESLTLRVGRFQTPFGEEYHHRNAEKNPLISNSISDIWGVDEGVSLFGSAGRVDYAVAVQNGGHQTLREGDPDKSIALRVGFRPNKSLRASVSAMRTGDLDVKKDMLGELWFGNSYLVQLGDPNRTRTFGAELVEADIRLNLPGGHLALAAGVLHYDDTLKDADLRRDAPYGYVEGVQTLAGDWYVATRLSGLRCDEGYPVIGLGNGRLANAEEIWRWSLGTGYRWSKNLTLKAEYSLERGRLGSETAPLLPWQQPDDAPGSSSSFDDRDQFAIEAVYAF